METKQDVMNHLGWPRLLAFVLICCYLLSKVDLLHTRFRLLGDPDESIQEQAYSAVRNLAEDEQGMDMIIEGLGSDPLFDYLAMTLDSKNEDIVLQVREAFRRNAMSSH